MPLNLLGYNLRLETCKQRFTLGYREDTTSPVRSIEPASYSTGLPGTTSTTSLIVHFIQEINPPHNFAHSRLVLGRRRRMNNGRIHQMCARTQIAPQATFQLTASNARNNATTVPHLLIVSLMKLPLASTSSLQQVQPTGSSR